MAEGMVQLPAVVENTGFGGMGLGAGFIGGLVLGSIWNGNGFGGYGNRAGQVGADVAIQNGIQNLSNQAQQNAISQLQSANQIGLQVANAAADVTAGITQNTVAGLQSQNAMQQQLCCCCNNLSKEIDSTGDGITAALTNSRIQDMQNTQTILGGLSNIGQAITSQGYESRLQAQALAAQVAEGQAALSRQIFEENCRDRELMREIAAQAVRDQLTQAQAKIVQLETQNYVNQSNSQQTLYLINQLKPAATAAAGA